MGRFLRRIVLFFERLNFSEVSNLHASFKQYYEDGIACLTEAIASPPVPQQGQQQQGHQEEGGPDESCDDDVEVEVSFVNCKTAAAATSNGLLNIASMGAVSRQQAELYIRYSMLQTWGNHKLH